MVCRMRKSPSQELIPNPSRDFQFVKVGQWLISSLAVLVLSYQYRCIASLQCSLKKQGKLLSLLCCANADQSFRWLCIPSSETDLNSEGSQNWNGENSRIIGVIKVYIHTMYFQGRRNTSNMLRSLKQKQRKVWTSSHKIYQAKMFIKT